VKAFTVLRFIYSALLWLLLPYVLFRLLWRARKQPEYRHHIGERFGYYSVQSNKPVIWLHAVSVGETRATMSLVAQLRAEFPNHQLLLTHTTPTGRSASQQLFGDSVKRVYFPYDYPFAINGFLRHFRPRLGILMETEIWFNLIHACHTRSMPLVLLNARMSEKSTAGYKRFSQLTRNALGELSVIAAQTRDDAARLTMLGGKDVSVMGNLKFDIEPPAAMLELGKHLREQFGATRKVLLAASTREGEEVLILDVIEQIRVSGLLLVIVPRHPQRFSDVGNLLEKRGIPFQRRSEERAVTDSVQVVLGDSMGEMFAYYAASDIAFIGGSLLPFGGQNLIEACAVGTPVLVGPHTYNFAEVTQLAVEAGAALQVRDNLGLIEPIQNLLESPDALSDMRRQCDGFVRSNRGATDRSVLIIKTILDSR
jgi:3-deoxy-D-manno-octulosonic-acid transferase